MDEQKIREAAYQLWEKQGKPHGQDLEHWFNAEQSGAEIDSGSAPSKPTPGTEEPSLADENVTTAGDGQKQQTVP